jgi:hypothetical protein
MRETTNDEAQDAEAAVASQRTTFFGFAASRRTHSHDSSQILRGVSRSSSGEGVKGTGNKEPRAGAAGSRSAGRNKPYRSRARRSDQ